MHLDAHQHFWRYDREQYAWMDPEEMSVLRRDYLPDDLAREQAKAGFHGSVAVQARQTLEESRWLLQLARGHAFIRGVVGWVDLRSDRVDEPLREFSKEPKFVGVRHVVQDELDDRFLLRPEFLSGLRELKQFRLAYDILIYPKQLPAAIELVRELPEQPFVLDHLAKPAVKTGALSPWREQIRELAQAPNVFCKVSGLVTEAHWRRWQPADFKPYLDAVFEAFGENRVMAGSDWPVCLLSASYGQAVGLISDYTEAWPAAAREKLFRTNAERFYALP